MYNVKQQYGARVKFPLALRSTEITDASVEPGAELGVNTDKKLTGPTMYGFYCKSTIKNMTTLRNLEVTSNKFNIEFVCK